MAKYIGKSDYRHDSRECLGILISNLGTPDAPTTSAVRRYLAEFLSDPRVIEVPAPLWWLILHGIILRLRPRKSASAYRKIWTDEGSPLLAITGKQSTAIQSGLSTQFPGPVRVEFAMRYGNPSIKSGLEKLCQANARRILVFPLYPQYSAATTASTYDAVFKVMKSWRWLPELRLINHYHDDENYINALAESIKMHWQIHGQAEKLLFSFHGIPKHYFTAGDPYFCECHKTARLVAGQLGLNDDRWLLTFQSRFGPREWLSPYTGETLQKLATNGTRNVSVICPGFSADCLETLEEINIQYRALFMACGGEQFTYIPALNDHPLHISCLTSIIKKHCQGWPEASKAWCSDKVNEDIKTRESLVKKLSD